MKRFFDAKFFDDGKGGLDCLHDRTVPSSTFNDALKLALRTTAREKSRFLDWLAWRSSEDTAPEEGKVMKAFLVLAAIYVAAFLIAIQGASQTSADGVGA